jgi:hypothetical protein
VPRYNASFPYYSLCAGARPPTLHLRRPALSADASKLDIPGIVFANDPTAVNGVLYISDHRSDQLFSVEPADFLKAKKPPKITAVFKGKGIIPNGVYPGKNGLLVMVGMESKDKPHGIYEMA